MRKSAFTGISVLIILVFLFSACSVGGNKKDKTQGGCFIGQDICDNKENGTGVFRCLGKEVV